MAKVEFPIEEFALLQSSIKRLMELRKDTSAKDWTKGENAVLKELDRKFNVQPDGLAVVIPMQRRHVRAAEDIAKAGLSSLERVEVNYMEAQKKQVENPNMFDKYITNVRRMKETLEAIKARLEYLL